MPRLDSNDVQDILNTRLTRMFGVKYPIIQAGMGYLARDEMAAAVSEAGGLGILGSSGDLTPDGLDKEIKAVKERTSKPFGVNFLFATYDDSPAGRRKARELDEMVDVALGHDLAVIGAGLGVPPEDVIRRAKSAGTLVMCTTGATRHVVKAQEAGVDVVVAQGWEAGGHNSRVGSMALLAQVNQVARVPFAAAGGFASGGGLVAALALGASAVYMGTVFAASLESRAHENFKDALISAKDTDTVVSAAHSGKPARLLRNEFTDYFERHPEELKPFPVQFELMEPRAVEVRVEGKIDRGGAPAGQITGYLKVKESVRAIIDRVVGEAEAVLTDQIYDR